MTTMQKIIDKLASKEPEPCCGVYEQEYKPVYIGDVLEFIKINISEVKREGRMYELVRLWMPLGLSKSLQEIAECGYETIVVKNRKLTEGGGYPKKILKDPNAQSLAEFINSIL